LTPVTLSVTLADRVIRSFRHKALERYFRNGKAQGIRSEHLKRLDVVLARLNRARTLADLDAPGLRLHALKGEYKGWLSVSVSGNWRVIFQFNGQDVFEVDYLDYH
jgi:proteic killer suppression protein